MSKAESAASKSEYAAFASHTKTFIDGYKTGQNETAELIREHIKNWFFRNKEGIMGSRDVYADLWVKHIDNIIDVIKSK